MPTEVLVQGFSSQNYRFKDELIHYGFIDCSMGNMLVAATDTGVCLTEINNHPLLAEEYLAKRYPQARLHPGTDEPFNEWKHLAGLYMDQVNVPFPTPLDVRGTPFQIQVWQALMQIPCGQTSTYGDIANSIRKPTAARAVGAAVGHNPIAVHIPCHRVIGKNGGLTGFRWGLDRKIVLLEREEEFAGLGNAA